MRINSCAVEVYLAQKEMTKAEFAEKSELSKQAVSTILRRGTCEPRTAGKIARALGVDVEELLAKEA